MECIEAMVLKTSFLVKTNPQLFHNDEVWCLAGINSVCSDDFAVEDLLNLDFPDKDIQDSHEGDEHKIAFQNHLNHSSSTFSGADDFDSLSAADLAVPIDDVGNLEWLSQFVDDSASEQSFPQSITTAGIMNGDVVRRGLPVEPLSRTVHKKPRSKRLRPHRRAWPMASSRQSAAEPLLVSSSNSTAELVAGIKLEGGGGSGSGRRCAHCLVQKTPQWRTGPLGPKTLCNACGVRFKSGRLYPEYRPACSPTFSQDLHSNSHRKVLEMRRNSEVAGGG